MKLSQIIALTLFSSVIIWGCAEKSEKVNTDVHQAAVTDDAGQTKTKAPEFKLKSTEGKEIKLSDFKGKVVVLDFWATWCGPCRKGVPDLVELQNEYQNKLVVIGVSLDEISGTSSDVKPFIQSFKINYPIVLGNEKVSQDYGDVQSIPTSFIIDQKGNIVNKHVGLTPKEVYVKQIKSLLSKS